MGHRPCLGSINRVHAVFEEMLIWPLGSHFFLVFKMSAPGPGHRCRNLALSRLPVLRAYCVHAT